VLPWDQLAAVGAFLSGAAAVITARKAIRAQQKRSDEECDKRIDALREGIHIGEKHPDSSD